jgi:restriction endonuclease Mrr
VIVKRKRGLSKRSSVPSKRKTKTLRPTPTRKPKIFKTLDENDWPTKFVTRRLRTFETEDELEFRTKAANMVRTKIARLKLFRGKSKPTTTNVIRTRLILTH